MKFFSVSAALFAVGMLVTSCWTSDDPVSPGGSGSGSSPKTAVVTDIDGAKYSVKVASNLPATFTIDATATSEVAADNKSATFSEIEASSVKVTVTYTGADAADYVNATQTAKVDFSKETTSASLDFVFVKKSESVAQATAIGGDPVVNTDKSVTTASITVPAGTTITGTTKDFSITAYKLPASAVKTDDIKEGKTFDVGGYILNCQPSGATFSTPVTVKVYVGTGLAGMTLSIKNGDDTVSGTVGSDGYASFAVSHFSDWWLKLPLKTLSEPTSFSELIPPIQTINAVSGENKFSYTKKIGFDVDLVQGNAKAFQFICDVLQSLYGDFSSSLTEEASFTVDGAGIANISVFQNKSKVKMSDLNDMFIFNVTYYDHVEYNISVSGTTHSGGSGK